MYKHTPTGNSPGMSLGWRVLEFPIGEGSLLELRDEALEVRPEWVGERERERVRRRLYTKRNIKNVKIIVFQQL